MSAQKIEFLFALGRNPDLSMAELTTYLDTRERKYRLLQKESPFSVLALADDTTLAKECVAHTGSILKVGERLACFALDKENERGLRGRVSQLRFCEGVEDRFSWGVSGYGDDPRLGHLWRMVKSQIRNEIKAGRMKGSFVWPRKAGALPFEKRFRIPLMPDDILRKRLIDRGVEVIVTATKGCCCLWRTLGVIPLDEYNERDFTRPHQRPLLSIAPSLARTMINLARLRPGDVVVDPFCGIGTILQEALLAGVRVKGLDIDAACVNMTVENLSWISRRFNLGLTKSNLETGIKVGDARELEKHLPKRSMHAVVTEPELGPPLQRLPTRGEAQQIISKAEKLYSRFLASAATILRDDGRIVLTFPVLRLQEGGFLRIRDTARMLEDAGLTLAGGPFQVRASESELHYSKTRMMEREICVLEKSC